MAAFGNLSLILDEESIQDMNPGVQVRKTKGRSREIVALLNKTNFVEIIKKIVPGVNYEKMVEIFELSRKIMQQSVLAEFRRIWTEEVDPVTEKEFYSNIYSNESQWAKPYNPDNFMSDEVDLPAFIQACLDSDLMQKSPFVKIFNKTPEDFLTNWEAYHHQVKDGTLGSHYHKSSSPTAETRKKVERRKSILKKDRNSRRKSVMKAPNKSTSSTSH